VAGSTTSPAASLTDHCHLLVGIHPPGLLNRVVPHTKPVGLLCHRTEASVGASRHASPGIKGARVVGLVAGGLARGFDSAGSVPSRLAAGSLRVVWSLRVSDN